MPENKAYSNTNRPTVYHRAKRIRRKTPICRWNGSYLLRLVRQQTFVVAIVGMVLMEGAQAEVPVVLENIESGIGGFSIRGINAGDRSGSSVSMAGDVNGDGYNDFLLDEKDEGAGASSNGKTYLFFGMENGWTTDQLVSDANASFIGEYDNDDSGWSVSGAGDVNNDGYDDIIIGAPYNDERSNAAGQAYVIFGMENGWVQDFNLSNSEAEDKNNDLNNILNSK